MLEILRLTRTILELLGNLGQPLRAALLQPLLTVAMLVFLYAGWHVRDEGSISAGLRVAFVDTRAFRAEHMQELEVAQLQGELHQAAATDKLIDQLLQTLLQRAAPAARVRLAVMHNGVTGLTGTALMRYDITNGVADVGHAVGAFPVNQPLSDWSGFLPTLMAGNCDFRKIDAETNATIRARLVSLGAGSFAFCPVTDIQSRMLGAVFITWDERDVPPAGEELRQLMVFANSICVQIAAALDLRGHLLLPTLPGVAG